LGPFPISNGNPAPAGQLIGVVHMSISRVKTALSLALTVSLFAVLVPGPAVASTAAPADIWRRVPTSGPGPTERSAPAAAGIGGGVYVFGGARDDFSTGVATFYNDLRRLDIATSRWRVIPPAGAVPAPRAFAAAASDDVAGGRMFVFGGSTFNVAGTEFQPFGDLSVFSVATGAWTTLSVPDSSTRPHPGARSGANLWSVGDRLYLFGGIDATFATHNDLWTYDLRHGGWSLVPVVGPPPPPRHVAQAGTVARFNRLTIYGGEGIDPAAGFTVFGDTWQFDLVQRRWFDATPRVGNIAPPRNYGAAAVVGPAMYLHGGDVPGGVGGCGAPFEQNPVAELWRFDLAYKVWRRLNPAGVPLARLKRHAAATVSGRMYIVSGWDFRCDDGVGPGQIWNLDVYAFSPAH
jgi:N-acetylneuraminic acid mutarotase